MVDPASAPPLTGPEGPVPPLIEHLRLADLRAYASLELAFGPGAHLVWGPNAAGKTSLLEAMVVLARGGSHRTTTDSELIRWGADVARIEGQTGSDVVDVALVRPGSEAAANGGRKRIRVNGVARRAASLAERLRVVLFAPEDMLLVAGSPSLRRSTLDQLATTLVHGYATELATYGRALQQRNSLLRAIRDETASREELRYWDQPFLDAGGAVVAGRHALLARLAPPLAAAHAEIAPEEAAAGELGLEYVTNAPAGPDETPRDALARRLRETAEKELWNGTTLIGPHRDDIGVRDGRAGPCGVRLARAAAHGDPCAQARRAGPRDRRTTAARRSSSSTTSSPSSTRRGAPISSAASRSCPRRSSPRPRPPTSMPRCARSRRPGRSGRTPPAPASTRAAEERDGWTTRPSTRPTGETVPTSLAAAAPCPGSVT